ncbi:MAG TPA: hypothetical protein VGQ29_14675 [Gemmatimonadales bacterium]|nr:hypothetical protein [Gemmatimonadales bacterium]
MPEMHPVPSPRPIGPPPYEPVVRLGSPGASHPNHPLLLPQPDSDDDLAPVPARPTGTPIVAPVPKPHWYRGLVRPTAYIASGLAGAVLVTVLYGILGSRTSGSGGRSGSDAAPGGIPVSDTAQLDRRADTLALAISAFTMRASMYDSRRMPCSGLARGLTQVEDGWLAYNLARKDLMAGSDPARDARDKGLYADVRAVEVRFERSSCQRP